MLTELYSVRSDKKEVALIAENISYIADHLNKSTNIMMNIKTEIDSNPKKIKAEILSSFKNKNKPDFVIFANALDTPDSSSFRRLFAPLIEEYEKDHKADEGIGKSLQIKVYPLPDPSSNYLSYCFIMNETRFLVMPRITLVGGSFAEFLCDTVRHSKAVFDTIDKECTDGFCLVDEADNAHSLNDSKLENTLANEDATVVPTAEELKSSEPSESSQKAEPASSPKEADGKAEEPDKKPEKAESAKSAENGSTEETDKKQPSKFKKFILSFIPHKGDTAKNIIIKIVVLAAICVFLVSAGILLDFYVIEPWKNSSVMSEIQDIYYNDIQVPATDAEGNTLPEMIVTKNWAGLGKVNKEIVGWIKVDKTKVDYPVLYHKGDNMDSQFYLYRNYKKQYSDFGSIFIDYRCTKGVESKNVILHGHNMGSDDSMFGSLLQYSRADGWVQGNTKFYKSSPIIHFDTPKSNGEWIIFAVMKIDVSNDNKAIFNYLLGDFNSDAQFMNFIYNIKERSYLSVDVPINESDRIITLSTCSYESDNMRTVLVGRLLRDGESCDGYVKTVKKNSPVGKVTSTFSAEYGSGNIKWYDGKGDLSGDETLDYMEQADMFLVKFIGGDGKEYAKQYVIKGKDATAPTANPRKASDGNYYYTFKGWDTSLKNITKNTTIKALFTRHKLNITVPTTTRVTETEEIIVTPQPPSPQPTQAPPAPPAPPTARPTEAQTAPPTEFIPVITEPPFTTNPVEAPAE